MVEVAILENYHPSLVEGESIVVEVKLLLDEQIIGLTEHLKVLGWTTISVDNVGLRRTGDDVIVKFAKDEGYIIITK